MSGELVVVTPAACLPAAWQASIPTLFTAAGERAETRFIEFFTANISNRHTRTAYAQAVRRFCRWCESHGLPLQQLVPVHIAAYIEELGGYLAKPSVKQHLAALRMLFDYLVTGQVVPHNPAAAVRGPKYVIKKGKTPVLTQDEARALFDAIDHRRDANGCPVKKEDSEMTVADLRDRALIGTMVFSFARIGAVLAMDVDDYRQQGKRGWLRLHEKGGKHHEVPVHHRLEEYLDAYLAAGGIAGAKGAPLFRSIDAKRRLTGNRLVARDALAMIKRRARAADLGASICCHSFRATGITAYLRGGGSIERAAAIASHESTRTTQLYNRTDDAISLDEIERIQI
jgi:site-specific recombinase XerD